MSKEVTTTLCQPVSSTPTIDKSERQILHYAADYLPRKLRKKFARQPTNKTAQLYKEVRSSWIGDKDDTDVPEGVKEWTKAQDCGGLLYVDGKFYYFMLEVEMVIRPLVNCDTLPQYRDTGMLTTVVEKLKNNENVLVKWRQLVDGKLESSELSEKLLDQVLNSWVVTRGTQAVMSYTFHAKVTKVGNSSRMGTPALRKTLDKFKN